MYIDDDDDYSDDDYSRGVTLDFQWPRIVKHLHEPIDVTFTHKISYDCEIYWGRKLLNVYLNEKNITAHW